MINMIHIREINHLHFLPFPYVHQGLFKILKQENFTRDTLTLLAVNEKHKRLAIRDILL